MTKDTTPLAAVQPTLSEALDEEVHITVKPHVLQSFLAELEDWCKTEQCATLVASGRAAKTGTGFAVVHWHGKVPQEFREKLYFDRDVLDYRLYPVLAL